MFKAVQNLILFVLFLASWSAKAQGVFELSGGFSFEKMDYGGGSYNWTRRYTGSLGYHFTARSQVEFSYGYSVNRTKIEYYQDITTTSELLSLSWVQELLPKEFPLQPFVKGGAGQLYRRISGTYYDGSSPPKRIDSLTAVLGIGFRVMLSERLGVKTEANSYLEAFKISTWKNNVSYMFGFSLFF